LRSFITVVLVAISTPPQRSSALALVLQINPISTASDNATGHRVLFRIKREWPLQLDIQWPNGHTGDP
jgi:hypothetical protein